MRERRLHRRINWLQSAAHGVRSQVPEVGGDAEYVAERLALVFLERLPESVASRLLRLLPGACAFDQTLLSRSAKACANPSIGYTEFLGATRNALGVRASARLEALGSEEGAEEMYRRVADGFLWALIRDIPPELKEAIADHLPQELRARMNIYCASADEARVA